MWALGSLKDRFVIGTRARIIIFFVFRGALRPLGRVKKKGTKAN